MTMAIQARNSPRLSNLALFDAALRLGPHALAHYALYRLGRLHGGPARALADRPAVTGAFLPETCLRPAPELAEGPMPGWPARLRAALAALPSAGPHGPFDGATPALALDLFGAGDIRPVWEANRLAWAPLLVQAARLWPEEGHLARLEQRLAAWQAANPAYRGPNWACGQEAALRALHLALALLLAGAEADPSPAARGLLALHAHRIRATAAYARAQDNNHSISEPAGLLACGWLLGEAELARRGEAALARAVARLVAPDGGFAQHSTGYHRLLLDTLSVLVVLRLRLGRPPLPAPVPARAAAAAHWLARLVAAGGALPALGHQDGSAFADLALGGAADARGSVERAMRLFAGASAGFAAEPGCRWLDLPEGAPMPPVPRWTASGSMGWAEAGARGLLRTGPLHFRPGQSDLLHFELWHGDRPLLTDAGTGAYNPPPGQEWWLDHFPSARAHNSILFDGQEPMPRAGRFLYAHWPWLRPLPDGALSRDRRGRRHARRVAVMGREWRIIDEVGGRFRSLTLRWRLGPGAWRLMPEGVTGPALLRVTADAPLHFVEEEGWESPAYGVVRPCRVLAVHAAAPVSRIVTRVTL